MTFIYRRFLTIATVTLVAICYAVAAPGPSLIPSTASVSHAIVREFAVSKKSHLRDACHTLAADLHRKLPKDWSVAVRGPFVLGGDYDEAVLEQHYQQTIEPTARALRVQYFDHLPTGPITILLCSSQDSYRECHRRLNEKDRSEYSGIYSRTNRRVVVNISDGEGVLAHELTHALAHADFPDLPEWLDEGLASLHEECEISSDGMRLVGLDNWRCHEVLASLQAKQLRPVRDLAAERFAATSRASLDYAHARSFCLFLQKRQLLEPFYRKCRARNDTDATGLNSLCELFETEDCHKIDDQFHRWLRGGAKNDN